jgi:ATP-dependent protease ClpP protease subunit
MTSEFEVDAEDDDEFGAEELDIAATSVEIARVIALGEKYQAEADCARWQAKREKLAYREERLAYEWQLDGSYSFTQEVTEDSCNNLLHAMSLWHKHDPHQPWTIYLNSVGGEWFAGAGVVDELISHSLRGGGTHEITIKARGLAASMAGIILQAGDYRVIGRNAQLMIHRGGGGVVGTADEIAAQAEWWRHFTDWMISYFLDRTDRISREEFAQKIDRRDWYLTSVEALELGFVDRIG